MPIPISKVKERDRECEAQFDPAELMNLLPLVQIHPVLLFQNQKDNRPERDAIRQVWLNSSEVDGEQIELTPAVPVSAVAMLKSKGFLKSDGELYEFTTSGRRLLKDAILEDEESEFCKQASKQLVSKNSYDFGEEVLIRVNHPEKFGARYISLPKKSFSNKKVRPKTIDGYNIATRDKNDTLKEMDDYSDEELIAVLHLAKNIIGNASKIAERSGQFVPVNRIKAFADMIMTELNSEREVA